MAGAFFAVVFFDAGAAVRPDRAVLLPEAGPELLAAAAEAVPGLLPAPRDTAERDALRSLGVRTLTLAAVSTALGSLSRPAGFWAGVYAALDATGAAADDLADLPMLLAGGRTVLGARGCLVPDVSADWLVSAVDAVPGLRLLDPETTAIPAARRLLLRIGAVEADPSGVLADPAVLDAVAGLRADLEEDDVPSDRVVALGTAVLDLIAAGGDPGQRLRDDLLLTTADDEPWPATELALPGSPLTTVLAEADLETVGPSWTAGWSDDVLHRAGVLAGFRVIVDDAATGPDHDLPDEERWWDEVIGDGVPPAAFSALADLDLVDDDRWPAALALIAADPAARDTLAPVDDRPSWTAWWLGRHARLAGRPPTAWRSPDAHDLAGLYDPLPEPVPASVATAVGVRAGLVDALSRDPAEVLRRFADPAREVPAVRVAPLTTALIAALAGTRVDPLPPGVRVLTGAVVDADDAVVVDLPWYAAVLDPATTVPGGPDPAAVAALWDLDTASERYRAELVAVADPDPVVPAGAAAALGLDPAAVARVRVDPELRVDVDGTVRRVPWWVAADGPWVDGTPAGWGRVLAWLAGDPALRHTATAWVVGDTAGVVEDGLGTPAVGTTPPPDER